MYSFDGPNADMYYFAYVLLILEYTFLLTIGAIIYGISTAVKHTIKKRRDKNNVN